jgi:very-short-patch-repair endonuclease
LATLIRVEWTDLTRRQGGIVSRDQLLTLGLTGAAVNGMLYRGRLERTSSRAVYRAPGAPTSDESMSWLAVLATRSPLSYLSAAPWWQLPVPDDGRVHITRFDRKRIVWPPGVRVHRVLLSPSLVVDRGGMVMTNRVETLLDCLGWLPPSAARTLADRAKQQGWLSTKEIERRLENQPGRWGNRQLRRLLSNFGDNAHSEAERRLHKLLRAAGLTGWQSNLDVIADGRRYVVDVAFARQRIAIEVDGFQTHSGLEAFQSDRAKVVKLRITGWAVLRFTWGDLVDRPDYVVAAITSLLAA